MLMKTMRHFYVFLVTLLISVTSLSAQYSYMGLVGDATPAGWDPAGLAMEQDPADANLFIYRGPLHAGEIKIHTEAADWGVGDWIMPANNGAPITETSYIITQGDPDNKWLLDAGDAGNYILTVDQGAQTIQFEKKTYYTALYLLGSATPWGWDIGAAGDMMTDEANEAVFHWVGTLGEGTFKIGTARTFDDGWEWIMPVTAGQDLALTDYKVVVAPNADDQWSVTAEQAGNYKVTVDLQNEDIFITQVASDATLSAITVSEGTLSPAFDPSVTEYFVTVPAGTSSVEVTATPNDDGASLTGTGTVDVSSGSGTATLVVTADDGLTTETYTVNIDVGASTDATLSDLTVSAGNLDPAFSPSTTDYNLLVPEGTTSVDVSATASNAAATITGTGTVDVSPGSGTATITVTAEDETTTKTYTVHITVDAPAYYEQLYMIGPATSVNWDIAQPDPMTVDNENPAIFTWEDTLTAGQFKIVTFTGDWCQGDEIVPTVDNQVLTATDYEINAECAGNDHKWNVETPGVYHVEVDLENETIQITLVNEITITYDMVYLVGDGTPSGWDIANPVPMVQDATNDKIFTWTGTLTAGHVKFSTFIGDWCDGDWILAATPDQALTATGYTILSGCVPDEQDYKWLVTEADTGTYDVTVNLEAGTVVFEKQQTNGISSPAAERVTVYPNPATGFVTVALGQHPTAEVSVYGLTGRLLHRQQVEGPAGRVDVTAMEHDGLVLLKVQTGTATRVFSIMVNTN